MQNMPSMEQMFHLFQKRAVQGRKDLQRFRLAMIDALTPQHRTMLGKAVADNALAAMPDREALVRRIDAILTQNERERVAGAMTAYIAQQEAMRPAFEADFARQFPELAKNASPEPSRPPIAIAAPSTSAPILASWLLAPQPKAFETMTFEQSPTTTPFTWSGPDTEQLQRRMRLTMLGALSPPDRSGVSSALAAYAVSPEPDAATFAKRLNALLSKEEGQKIRGAYAEFAAAQKASFLKSRAQFDAMRAQIPAGTPMQMPSGTMDAAVPDAGTALYEVLIGGGAVKMQLIGPNGSAGKPK